MPGRKFETYDARNCVSDVRVWLKVENLRNVYDAYLIIETEKKSIFSYTSTANRKGDEKGFLWPVIIMTLIWFTYLNIICRKIEIFKAFL